MKIDKEAALISEIYGEVVDKLLINIAKHLAKGKAIPTAEYEIRMMAELGALTKENIAIIKKGIGAAPKEAQAIFEKAFKDALKDVEPALAKAFAGKSVPALETSMASVIEAFRNQAFTSLNMINQTMITSSVSAYITSVSRVAAYERAQGILEAETLSTALGISSRQQSLRRATREMVDKGITGFVDSAGRNWTPEAYSNMVIRSTSNRIATESVFQRNLDYGNDLIVIPTKAGARPLCYPYQGKIYSTNNRSGYVKDGNGKSYKFEPLSSTSYGEPAGLFGINCGHTPPDIFIPDFSIKRSVQRDKEKNDEEYQLSQQQRTLERKVRYAKRDVEVAKAIGDDELLKTERAKLKASRENLNSFISSTGRTARADRLYIAK